MHNDLNGELGMGWFLKIKDGASFRDIAAIRDSRQLVIGRASNVDLSFPDDFEMSSRHARVMVTQGVCVVEDLQSTNGTFLNEERIDRTELASGQMLRCGGTVFLVEQGAGGSESQTAGSGAAARTVVSPVGGASAAGASAAGASAAGASAAGAAAHEHKHEAGSAKSNAAAAIPEDVLTFKGYCPGSASEIFEQFKLASVVEMKPLEGESTDAFVRRCLKSPSSNDGLNFLARALPKRLGVWWAIQCIREVNAVRGPYDKSILETAEMWVRAPSESLRRELMKLADAAETSTAAAWVGVAVFWSHGSMAPPDGVTVPVPPDLASKALSGAVILAAVATEPEKAPQKREGFMQKAVRMAAGEDLPK